MHSWNVFPDFETASQACADFLALRISEAIGEFGVCRVALPGGGTPGLCLGILAQAQLPWQRVHWYLGDERCCPQGHDERNDVMLEKHFWSRLDAAVVHRIPAELGASEAARVYSKDIDAAGSIDIAFLGMGEDGHTASLFPGNEALTDGHSVVPVYDAPKPPPERVSLGMETLKRAGCRIVLACGEGKTEILDRIKKGEPLPVNSIGDIYWYLDQAAWGE